MKDKSIKECDTTQTKGSRRMNKRKWTQKNFEFSKKRNDDVDSQDIELNPVISFSKIIIEEDNDSFGLKNFEHFNNRQKTFCQKRRRHISFDNANSLIDRARITEFINKDIV